MDVAELPPPDVWPSERFTVVDAGDGKVGWSLVVCATRMIHFRRGNYACSNIIDIVNVGGWYLERDDDDHLWVP